jgi:hypothetical protein
MQPHKNHLSRRLLCSPLLASTVRTAIPTPSTAYAHAPLTSPKYTDRTSEDVRPVRGVVDVWGEGGEREVPQLHVWMWVGDLEGS